MWGGICLAIAGATAFSAPMIATPASASVNATVPRPRWKAALWAWMAAARNRDLNGAVSSAAPTTDSISGRDAATGTGACSSVSLTIWRLTASRACELSSALEALAAKLPESKMLPRA